MCKRLPKGLHGFLKNNLQALSSLQQTFWTGGIPTGSACSGSDLVTPALIMLLQILYSEKLDIADIHEAPFVDVKWGCENVGMKQRWLREAMQVRQCSKT